MSPVNHPMMNMPPPDMPYVNDRSLTCYGITVAQEYEKEYNPQFKRVIQI